MRPGFFTHSSLAESLKDKRTNGDVRTVTRLVVALRLETAMTREQIEAVLRKHQIMCQTTFSPLGTTASEIQDTFLDDLLALYPQPSRKKLERLWELHDHQYPSAKKWREAMLDAVMAWAMGQETNLWCPHIVWNGQCWQHYRGGLFVCLADEEWQCCPVCAIPRPMEARDE